MRKLVVTCAVALALFVGIGVPGSSASATTLPGRTDVVYGCNDEPVQKKPGAMPPFRYGKKIIHFGYTEWHFPPSCRDQVRRDYVKVYKVKKGKDPKIYSTTGDRASKKFKKGTYRVKVRYGYRYWNAKTKKYGEWHTMTVSKTVRIR